jgi:hypothetical protein
MAFNITKKLGGIFGGRPDRGKLREIITIGDNISAITKDRRWASVERILQGKLEQAVKSRTLPMSPREWDRINDRIELINEIFNAIKAAILAADEARLQLSQMQEADNARRTK